MTLNSYNMIQPQLVDHSMLSAELEEAQMVKAQQNAATLLYLQNRDRIWNTNSCAIQGSDYLERLERINQGDQLGPGLVDDPLLSHPFASSSLGFSSLPTGKSPHEIQTQPPSASTYQWLQMCECEIRKACEILARIQQSGSCPRPIELLEDIFDKVDDVNILLDSLEVESSLALFKTQVHGNAEALCTEIEKTAKSFCM